jgi:hypothetical protein
MTTSWSTGFHDEHRYGAVSHGVLALGSHRLVIEYEEPTLRSRFGDEYEAYRRSVSHRTPRPPGGPRGSLDPAPIRRVTDGRRDGPTVANIRGRPLVPAGGRPQHGR